MISKTFFLVFLTSILLTAGIFSTVNAQSPGTNNGSNSQNKPLSTIIPKKSFGVRITSPMAGDQVFINGTNYFNKNGEKLSILGTSASDTNSSSACSVSIIVNSVKPYQTAIGTGSKGNNDYSTWKYSFTPLYIPLKEGSNKITSKLTCQPGNTAAAFYSVNVTGSKFNGTFPNKGTTPLIVQSKSFNNAVPLNLNTKSIVPAPTTTTAPTTTKDQPTSTIPLEFKSMNIVIDKKGSGNRQTIVITVRDSITDKPVSGVSLSGNINNETFSGITNSSGKFSKGISSSIIKSSSTIDITVTGTADGYKSNKASTTFDITSSSNSTTGTKNNGKSGAKDMASKIANDVQNQLSKQGINIPLPFG
ncbi:MAG: hypothetical protein ABJB76_10945 [Candidatus Nitrosocosmicus sp.]